nr:hypothetical protein [Oryctes rhinoceros nudivirus]
MSRHVRPHIHTNLCLFAVKTSASINTIGLVCMNNMSTRMICNVRIGVVKQRALYVNLVENDILLVENGLSKMASYLSKMASYLSKMASYLLKMACRKWHPTC